MVKMLSTYMLSLSGTQHLRVLPVHDNHVVGRLNVQILIVQLHLLKTEICSSELFLSTQQAFTCSLLWSQVELAA